MDNIQKMIVGCLGLIGLVVLIVPNKDPLASNQAGANEAPLLAETASDGQTPPAPPPPPPPPTPSENSDTQAEPSTFVVEDYDIGTFGQPMMDPTPPGQRNQQAQQQNANAIANGQTNSAQQQSNDAQNTGSSNPPPAEIAPAL